MKTILCSLINQESCGNNPPFEIILHPTPLHQCSLDNIVILSMFSTCRGFTTIERIGEERPISVEKLTDLSPANMYKALRSSQDGYDRDQAAPLFWRAYQSALQGKAVFFRIDIASLPEFLKPYLCEQKNHPDKELDNMSMQVILGGGCPVGVSTEAANTIKSLLDETALLKAERGAKEREYWHLTGEINTVQRALGLGSENIHSPLNANIMAESIAALFQESRQLEKSKSARLAGQYLGFSYIDNGICCKADLKPPQILNHGYVYRSSNKLCFLCVESNTFVELINLDFVLSEGIDGIAEGDGMLCPKDNNEEHFKNINFPELQMQEVLGRFLAD